MKTISKIRYWALSILALGMLSGCQQPMDEMGLANAVGVETATMTFDAIGAQPQTLQVYSDGEWVVECDAEWVSLDPMTGVGSTEVAVTVLDNSILSSGKMVENLPRQTRVAIRGGSSDPSQNASVTILQKGDTYFGKPAVGVDSFILDVEEGDRCKLVDVSVVALADQYCVVADELNCVLVKGVSEGMAVGKKYALKGERASVNGVPAMILDIADATGTAEVTYPVARDITETIASYAAEGSEYVRVAGAVVGFTEDKLLSDALLRVGEKSVTMFDQKASKELAAINYHNVILEGYTVGTVDGAPAFILVEVKEDGGLNPSVIPITPEAGDVIFKDDFSWLDPIVAAYREQAGADKVGDTVASADKSADAPNIWNIAALNEVFAPAFAAKGYTDLNPEEKLLYLQPGYLKMSRTGGHNTALQLQIASLPSSGVDVDITYDYCMMVQGDGTVDAGPVGVLLLGDGQFDNGTKLSNGNFSKQEKDTFGWQKTAVMKATGVTSRTKFVFLMHRIVTDEEGKLIVNESTGEPVFKWDVSGAGRIFIDNILIKASGLDVAPVIADIKVDEDVLAFEGEGGDKTIKITSTEDFTIETSASWISVDKAEGVKDEQTSVVVTVEASTLSQLREGTLTILSGDSEKSVRIIQSAAGQNLNPFISLDRNKVKISYREQEVSVAVQATHEYTITSDASWVSVAPATKALVEQTSETLLVEENTDKTASRVAHVVFAIESKGVESVLTITQDAAPEDNPNLLLFEDFDWMKAYFSAYEAASGKKVGDTIGSSDAGANSPQIYDASFPEGIREEFASRGWLDLNPGGKMVYINDAYLKLSKTKGNNTAVALSLEQYLERKSDLVVDFDYAMQIQGDGTVDLGPVVLLIDGDGVFENGTKMSEEFNTTQAAGQLAWQNVQGVRIVGATKNTKIVWINKRVINEDGTFNWSVSGAGRFFLDNIKIDHHDYIWEDNFSWLAPFIQAYNDAATEDSKKAADFMNGDYADLTARLESGNNYSVGLYSSAYKDSFIPERDKHGYTTLKADNSAVYANGTTENPYFKFCKNGKQDGLVFSPFTDRHVAVVVSLDWGRHMTSTALDAVSLQIRIEGDGEFENGTKNSDPAASEQTEVGAVNWTHSEFVIYGVSENTKISICSKEAFDGGFLTSGQHRYYVDNLKIMVK